MKISNSKKQLAKIIHENGGWCDGAEFTAQDGDGTGSIDFFKSKPRLDRDDRFWKGDYDYGDRITRTGATIKNWHQTILSRDEYFHLYQMPTTAAAPEPVTESKPTIEQLAADYRNRKGYADRKQQEADAAKADAEAKLAELVAAGKAHGLVLSVAGAEPELAITDWRDLRVGDLVEYLDGKRPEMVGAVRPVVGFDVSCSRGLHVNLGENVWPRKWRFIHRPAKGEANA